MFVVLGLLGLVALGLVDDDRDSSARIIGGMVIARRSEPLFDLLGRDAD